MDPYELTNREKQRHHGQHGRKIKVHSKVNIHLNLKDELFYVSKNNQLYLTVAMSGVMLSSLELTKSTKMWRRGSRILRSPMPNHPQLLPCCTRWKIVITIPMSYPIVFPKKTWLSDRSIDTSSSSAQVLVDSLSVSQDTKCVFLLHDPYSPLTGGSKKGRPKKSLPMRVATKDFNSQVVETEMVPEMPVYQHAIAR
jgi:hypothetical protein